MPFRNVKQTAKWLEATTIIMGGNSNWRGPVWCLSLGCFDMFRLKMPGSNSKQQVSDQLPADWVLTEAVALRWFVSNHFVATVAYVGLKKSLSGLFACQNMWRFHQYYGDAYLIEFPTGSGQKVGVFSSFRHFPRILRSGSLLCHVLILVWFFVAIMRDSDARSSRDSTPPRWTFWRLQIIFLSVSSTSSSETRCNKL